MKRFIALTFLVAAAASAQTEKVQQQLSDFAMQIPLHVSGQNGVVQLRLPRSVYEYAQSSSLADVRVFDSQGRTVPFAFFAPSKSAKVNWRESDVRLFPVLSDAVDDSQPMELDVRAAQDGAVLSVHAKGSGNGKGNELTALVLDLGVARTNESLESLQLFPPTNATTSYRANLAIEQSDDLKLWDRVAQSRVDWLKDATQSELINDRIELSARTGRYVRIHWLEGKPLQFGRIVARWRSTETPSDDAMEIALKGAPGKVTGDWVYATSAAIAADEIGLNLPSVNTVMPVSIGLYRQQLTPTRKWLFDPLINSTFYRLNQNGKERTSSRLHIAPIGNTEWVVRPQTAGNSAPELVLRWHPRTIVFTAQGEQTAFTLAFGANAEQVKHWLSGVSPMSLVAPGFDEGDLNQLEQAIAGSPSATTSPAATNVAVAESAGAKINKRTLLLWGVLIFGTLLLAGMSWRLFKQMNRDETS